MIATHRRCYEREQDVLDPQHFLRLLLECPGAWEHAKAIHAWQARWPKVYDRYLAALRAYYPEPQGVREFVRVLELHRTFSEFQITVALEWALAARCYTWEGVLHWLRQQTATTPIPEMEPALTPMAPPTPHGALPNLAQYQALVQLGGPDGN